MQSKVISLKKGIKVGYTEKLDYELAQIASTCFESNNPTVIGNSYQMELIKTKDNCRTYRLIWGNDVYYLKRFFEDSLFIKVRNVFRTSKAFRSYSISHKLAAANISVAEPLMFINFTKRIIEKESILVTKKVDGISLKEFLEQDISADLKEKILQQLFRLLGHFYKSGFKHGDPGLYNYFIDVRKDDYIITFLDLDVVHKIPRMPVIIALNGLAKMSSLSGRHIFGDNWSVYVKTFLDVFNPSINFDEAMDYFDKEREKRIMKYKKRHHLPI